MHPITQALYTLYKTKFIKYVFTCFFLVPPEIIGRGPLHVAAYNKALEEGETRFMRLPVMLIGQARSGKTSLKKSLKKEKFDEKELSTDGIERDPSYFSVTNEIMSSEETEEGQDVDFEVFFRDRMGKSMLHECRTFVRREASLEMRERNFGSLFPLVKQMVKNDADPSEEQSEKLFETNKESSCRKRFEVPQKTAACFEKSVNQSHIDDGKVYFTLWDFGGQSVYYATHPIFLTGKAIYLLVYDLTKDPGGKADSIERQGVFGPRVDSDCGKTNKDYLRCWMSSVAALESQTTGHSKSTSSGNLPEKLPPVILTCTHSDLVGSRVTAKTRASKIYGSLRHKFYSKHLYKKFFVVDNTKSGSAGGCEEVSELKGEILALAKQLTHMQKTIPLKWLLFEEALKDKVEKGQPFISLDETRKVAREKCGIYDDQQFETLLIFLHDQRILIHFHETQELKDIVILDPQWLIDLFRKVITVKPYEPLSDEEQYEELWEELENDGILNSKLIEIVWGPLINSKTKDSLIAIMEKFSLLCHLPSQDKVKQLYLVPSMLMSLSEDDANVLLADAPICPLFVRFRRPSVSEIEYVQMPLGFFQRLVVKFLNWCIHQEFTPLYEDMYQNFARFPIRPEGYSVILRCHSSSLEIVVYRDPDTSNDQSDMSVCDIVLEQLGAILQSLREECFWLNTIQYEYSVICPVCCQQESGKYYCKDHKEEEPLHFWTESNLQDEQARICRKKTLAKRDTVSVERFTVWFTSLRAQVR